MKWIKNDVKFERGNHECLIAQYDNNGTWYMNRAMQTQQSMKRNFKMFGEFLGASVCEVKRYWNDDDDEAAENDIVIIDGRGFDGEKCEKYVLWREREDESLERVGELERK